MAQQSSVWCALRSLKNHTCRSPRGEWPCRHLEHPTAIREAKDQQRRIAAYTRSDGAMCFAPRCEGCCQASQCFATELMPGVDCFDREYYWTADMLLSAGLTAAVAFHASARSSKLRMRAWWS